jgi:hypothetical protein
MGVRSAGELLTLPVAHQGIDLGRAVDVLLDLDAGHALGLEIRCGDEARRFLPFGAARLAPDATEVGSPLALLDDLAFYRARGTGLRELRGATVELAGRPLGTLVDVLLTGSVAIAELLVHAGPRTVRVPYGPGLSFSGQRRVSAA